MEWYSGLTFTYLAPIVQRPPGMCTLVSIAKFLFGTYWIQSIVLFNVSCVLLSILYVVRKMKPINGMIIGSLLALPLTEYYFWSVDPEPICYALLLYTFSNLYRFYNTGRLTFIAMFAMVAGVLFRLQMAIIPIAFCITALFLRTSKTIRGLVIVFILLFSFITQAIDIGFHKIYHGKYFATRDACVNDIAAVLYASEPYDYFLFYKSKHYKEISNIFKEMERQKLFGKYRGQMSWKQYWESDSDMTCVSEQIRFVLSNQIYGGMLRHNWYTKESLIGIDEVRRAAEIRTEMKSVLLKKNWKNYCKFVLVQLWQSVPEQMLVISLFLFCMFVIKNDLLCLFVLLLYWINTILISANLIMANKYLFYPIPLMYSMIAMYIFRDMRKR